MNINNLIWAGAAFLLSTSATKAITVVSPDRRFALEVGSDLTIVDSSGQPVLTLVQNTAGDTNIAVAWAPDSQRVVVVETSGRGTDIVAAWCDANTWHRTIELDEDLAGVIRQGEQACGGRLIADKRTLAEWVSNDAIRVNGEMTFSGNHRYNYTYTLTFVHGPITLSRGGYEDGAIVGRDYRSL